MGRTFRIVDVSFNGKKQSAIGIVDTGADETVISKKLADKLSAELHGTFLAKCASQTILEGKYARIKIKDLKSLKETTLEVGVSDIPFDTDDINEEGLEVILGVDFIQEIGLKLQ